MSQVVDLNARRCTALPRAPRPPIRALREPYYRPSFCCLVEIVPSLVVTTKGSALKILSWWDCGDGGKELCRRFGVCFPVDRRGPRDRGRPAAASKFLSRPGPTDSPTVIETNARLLRKHATRLFSRAAPRLSTMTPGTNLYAAACVGGHALALWQPAPRLAL